MSDREGGAGLQATPDFSERAQALLTLNEVQGENACRCIERTFRRTVDEPEA